MVTHVNSSTSIHNVYTLPISSLIRIPKALVTATMKAINLEGLEKVVRVVLTIELFLGGQARLTAALTPNLHKRAMARAQGTQKYPSFIRIQDPQRHTNFIGALMILAGALLISPETRLNGGILSIALTLAGVYTQYGMNIPYWLPSVNTVLAAIIIYGQSRQWKRA